ncbi:MAG: hypothetical protein IMW89_14245, partial [Ktedonobacteraceae bacterium]|nr:hypothetical protein [Ktedonobacteraceae bacterium]
LYDSAPGSLYLDDVRVSSVYNSPVAQIKTQTTVASQPLGAIPFVDRKRPRSIFVSL